jgi:hypothetical protein
MSNVFVQQPAIQKLLRDSAGLDVAGGDERFKAIIHRLLENICTLIDDYNVTEEEFWHAVNYLHELGGRQEAALLAAGLGSFGSWSFPWLGASFLFQWHQNSMAPCQKNVKRVTIDQTGGERNGAGPHLGAAGGGARPHG